MRSLKKQQMPRVKKKVKKKIEFEEEFTAEKNTRFV